MTGRLSYEVAVVGGGPAGMTAGIYTTRLGHRTAVFEAKGGRHASVDHVHNLFGVSEDVTGSELANHAVDQFLEYGGTYFPDEVTAIRVVEDGRGVEDSAVDSHGETDDVGFVIEADRATVEADRVVLATGFTDVDPDVPSLLRFTGRGLHYCLHCDAYSLGDGSVYVLGHDESAASVAMLMLNYTDDVDLLLDGREPVWDDDTDRQLEAHPIRRIDEEVADAFARDESVADPRLGGLTFADGTDRGYLGGFAIYGKEYAAELAMQLGCRQTDDGAIEVDETGETSVDGVYAVGDVTHGQNQTTIALGDGARAGIAIGKDLRRYPRPPDDLEGIDEGDVPATADDLRARMRLVRERDTHAGLRDPSPHE